MSIELKLAPAELPADAIEVGRIADAWGVKGWFKVLPYSNDPEALFSSKRWFLLPSERGARTFSGTALLSIKQARDHSDTVVASAQGIDDRSAAEALRGAITAAKTGTAPIQLLVQRGERFQTVPVDYHGGLRYPWLERQGAGPAGLDLLLAPRRPKP